VEQLAAASKIDDNENSPEREEILAGKDGGEQLVEINKDEEVNVCIYICIYICIYTYLYIYMYLYKYS
jgi:hypothetical protein